MDAALAVTAAVTLAVIAFRRRRGVAAPPRRPAGLVATADRIGRIATTILAVARVALGAAALAGIVVLTRRLFG